MNTTRLYAIFSVLLVGVQLRAEESVVQQLLRSFEDTKTVEEFRAVYRSIINRNEEIAQTNYAQFVSMSIGIASLYKEQVEQVLTTMGDTSYNTAMVKAGMVGVCSGLYGLSRLAVARFMPHDWWLRFPFLPISRLIACKWYGGVAYKLFLGLELLGGLTGGFGLYQGIQTIRTGIRYKQYIQKQITHIDAIIEYLQQELVDTESISA